MYNITVKFEQADLETKKIQVEEGYSILEAF